MTVQRKWIELAIEIGEWNFRNNWETCEKIIEEYNFLDDVIDEEGYDYAMDYATDKLTDAFDYLRHPVKELLQTVGKHETRRMERINQLEGFIKTIVDENPTIFCCFNCIPNAPNPPRHVVDVFGLGLEDECECKEDE